MVLVAGSTMGQQPGYSHYFTVEYHLIFPNELMNNKLGIRLDERLA